MEAKILKTEKEYEKTLNRILELNEPDPGTRDGDEFELLLLLVENYEAKNMEPIPFPHPVAAIKFRMEQMGYKSADLGRVIDSASHASEILNLRRPLSINHVRLITEKWGIPAKVLVREYEIESPKRKKRIPQKDRVTGSRKRPMRTKKATDR